MTNLEKLTSVFAETFGIKAEEVNALNIRVSNSGILLDT